MGTDLDDGKKFNVNRQSSICEHNVTDLNNCQSDDQDFSSYTNFIVLISPSTNFVFCLCTTKWYILAWKGHFEQKSELISFESASCARSVTVGLPFLFLYCLDNS